MTTHYRIWLWSSALGGVALIAWAAVSALGLLPEFSLVCHLYLGLAALATGLIGILGWGIVSWDRVRAQCPDTVAEAFRQGYDLRAEQCGSTCLPRPNATVLPFPSQRPALVMSPPPVVDAWANVDANATTVQFPKVHNSRRPRPRRGC